MIQKMFKRAQKRPEFSEQEWSVWPSVARDDNERPTNEELIEKGTFAGQMAKVLRDHCEEKFTKEDDMIDYQVVMQSRKFGLFVIPAVIRRKNGFILMYSHVGEWTEDATANFAEWVMRVRSTDLIHHLKIELNIPKSELPQMIREIASHRHEHLLMMNALPHLSADDQKMNAEVLADVYGYIYKNNIKLMVNRKCLEEIQRWLNEDVQQIPADSWFYSYFVRFVGSFLGEALKKSVAAEWIADPKGSTWSLLEIPKEKLKNPPPEGQDRVVIAVFAQVAEEIKKKDTDLVRYYDFILEQCNV